MCDLSPLSSALFGKARRALLSLFYGNPDEAFFLRQVVRLSGCGMGVVQRELDQLVRTGILRRTEKNNHVFFQANRACPIFEELRSLVRKTAGAVDVLRNALGPLRARILLAWIYGSVARGEEKSESDVDLIVVGDLSFREVLAALSGTESSLGREVNPTVLSPEEFHRRLAEKNHFLTSLLKNQKLFLIGDSDELKRLEESRMAR